MLEEEHTMRRETHHPKEAHPTKQVCPPRMLTGCNQYGGQGGRADEEAEFGDPDGANGHNPVE